ncbi:MAG: bifunctional diaminohydroxyphosphoribosylaminopyrimidine deaminase/5-amino-6-(5-phosphoribosylamino)uracil reductase RibD [Thermodesulfovibrionales bacterium]|nr:bifunctional diaminohydroxyphosphoribosylaminopyrimidine deaminase/5-amino-6-(5-phosphoribosylamino)uracil reductase RibD [Thermodesulfovibrionales bacterium]
MDDVFYMRRALRLAAKAEGRTSPNPMVGALIVKAGRVIAEDYHRRAGEPHAEALALEAAGKRAGGATLYVSLEPCCHTEKKTPPCTREIIRSGIKKVVIAMKDPNPKVAGRGIDELQAAGIEVKSGVLEKEALRLNEAYIKYITEKQPFVILKVAMTLDGKIATPTGESKWITGEKSRLMVHKLRSRADAVLTAIGTVMADDPELTSRIKRGRNPVRIVIDPELEIPVNAKILKTPPETIIVTKADSIKAKNIEKTGIKLIKYEANLELKRLMRKLGEMGMMSVLIEGGSSLAAHALDEGIVDKVMFFIAPKIIGGRDSYPAVGGSMFRLLGDAYRVRDLRVKRIGEDFLLEGYIEK